MPASVVLILDLPDIKCIKSRVLSVGLSERYKHIGKLDGW